MLAVEVWGGRGKYSAPCPSFLLHVWQRTLPSGNAKSPRARLFATFLVTGGGLLGSESGVATHFEFDELLFRRQVSRRQHGAEDRSGKTDGDAENPRILQREE